MAEGRRFALNPQLDIQQILLEAKSRWLRPSEICEILRNYRSFNLTPDPPYKPPGGSLFLFDRKALRYFRKDGHRWRKKKDGKTVREAHEKLKSGSVDVLHCYYAHGEDNENFQRRSYWMLDGQLEHIVLVHYRDVNEGSRSSIPNLLTTDPMAADSAQGAQTNITVCSTHLMAPFTICPSNGTACGTADWNRPTPSSELEDADSGDDLGGASFSDSLSSGYQIAALPGNDMVKNSSPSCGISHLYASGLLDTARVDQFSVNQLASQNPLPCGHQQKTSRAPESPGSYGGSCLSHHNALSTSSTWPEIHGMSRVHCDRQENKTCFVQLNCSDVVARRATGLLPDDCGLAKFDEDGGSGFLPDANPPPVSRECSSQIQVPEFQFYVTPSFKYNNCARGNIPSMNQALEYKTEASYAFKKAPESDSIDDGLGELKKLDSFGRWMCKEIGNECNEPLMASDPCNYWTSINTQGEHKDASSLSHHMQLDADSIGPSLSQEQLFSILDFSPEWAYSDTETKILISGTFLGGLELNSIKWCCMFGEHEVSAEVLGTSVIRCQAPPHIPGRVPFYITCGNRLACSEVREFQYRENVAGVNLSVTLRIEPEEESHLQVRFAKMLSLGVDRKVLFCSIENCLKCEIKGSLHSLLGEDGNEWDKIEKDSKVSQGYHLIHRDRLLQKLLKNVLYEWLVCKVHEEGKGPKALDEEGQGVIHLAAALGYEWAMSPIVAAGVPPSFRDIRGRTALHWAAYFGREETVVALVSLGAAPGAVEDPTSKFPEGPTAADLASNRGHKGIAGYLAEAALTSHLSSLTLAENVVDTVSATLAAEKAVEFVQGQNIVSFNGEKGDQLSLRGSLAAVRNSAQAAARIQAAFRFHSFRQRNLSKGSDENNEDVNDALVISSLTSKVHRTSHFNISLHCAATKIQQKYRGWKGRRDFLKIRNRIVKIQAHVRGHQVRKQYKKVVWSVSIVEKAILRWRRKRSGLRGFQSGKTIGDAEKGTAKTDEYDFLRLGRKQKVAAVEKALERVQSMVRYPEARDQYMRLVASSHKSKVGALDKLEAFMSFNGPDFYELPRNTSEFILRKSPWKVPESYAYASGEIVPMFAGQTLEWSVSTVGR